MPKSKLREKAKAPPPHSSQPRAHLLLLYFTLLYIYIHICTYCLKPETIILTEIFHKVSAVPMWNLHIPQCMVTVLSTLIKAGKLGEKGTHTSGGPQTLHCFFNVTDKLHWFFHTLKEILGKFLDLLCEESAG